MQRLEGRLQRLEQAGALGEYAGTRARQIRILLTEKDWHEVPVGALVHIGGNPPQVYRYWGGYQEVDDRGMFSIQAEEVDIPEGRSWGLQPVDYVVLMLG